MEMNMVSAKTASLEHMELNAVRRATARGESATERQGHASLPDSLPNLPATSSLNCKKLQRPGLVN